MLHKLRIGGRAPNFTPPAGFHRNIRISRRREPSYAGGEMAEHAITGPDEPARDLERDFWQARYWQAVAEREAAMDGVVWYAVVSTGIYCRPSCAARRPRRENVLFFARRDEA